MLLFLVQFGGIAMLRLRMLAVIADSQPGGFSNTGRPLIVATSTDAIMTWCPIFSSPLSDLKYDFEYNEVEKVDKI